MPISPIFAIFAQFAHPYGPPHGLGSSFLGTSRCVKYSCIDFRWDIENFFIFFFIIFCQISQFLLFLHILRILRTPIGHSMASVHHVWVQTGVWSIVALISGEISKTFSFFFIIFCPISQFFPFLHILRILRTPMGHPMASVHHVWVQAGVWSIVALISGEISRTFSFFFIIFCPFPNFCHFCTFCAFCAPLWATPWPRFIMFGYKQVCEV